MVARLGVELVVLPIELLLDQQLVSLLERGALCRRLPLLLQDGHLHLRLPIENVTALSLILRRWIDRHLLALLRHPGVTRRPC